MSKLKENKFQDFVGSDRFGFGITMHVKQSIFQENGCMQKGDTNIKVSGAFAVAGPEYLEFKAKLQGLLDEYQI